jgi:uncharacterized protein YxjI
MEIKLQCGCGTKYKFDVEPANGRMPNRVQCPNCGNDGTFDANELIARKLQYSAPITPSMVAVPAGSERQLSGSARASALAEVEAAPPHGAGWHAGGSLLERTTFFIKERVAVLKLTDIYDILDPATGQTIGIAKEEPPGWAKWLRLAVEKSKLPTAVNVYESEGQPAVLSIRRGFTLLRAKVQVTTGDGRSLGYFKSKLISVGGGFHVFDAQDQQVAEVKGNWKGWDFRFIDKHGREIGTVTKKWSGLGKELFTSADNYIISLNDSTAGSPDASALLLAAGLAIDVVLKERA